MTRTRLPGLVDVHAHLGLGESGIEDRAGVSAAGMAQLRAGVFLVREPGSPLDTLPADSSPAPRLIRSGRHIARPKRYLPSLALELEDPAFLPQVVVDQARRSDGWVKLVGDWIDRSGGAESDLDPLWAPEILIDAVAAAHESGARVAVHAFGTKAIDALLAAGVDSIEHGSGMTREHLQEAARVGIAVTPTLGQVELFPTFAAAAGRKYPRYAETMTALYQHWREWFGDLLESGVRILPGTDAGGYQPHGEIARELARMVQVGMDPVRAVDLVSRDAWDFLGVEPDPDSYVEYEGDPRTDINLLADPQVVVWAGSQIL